MLKSLLWRLRSNVVPFLVICAAFTAGFILVFCLSASTLDLGFGDQASFYGNMRATVGARLSLVKTSAPALAVFFLWYTKRYTPGEDYFYGFSRNENRVASLAAAAVYALLFGLFALSVAALTRTVYFASAWSEPSVRLTAGEYAANVAVLFVIGMLCYAAADSLRNSGHGVSGWGRRYV